MYDRSDFNALQPLQGDEFLPPIHRWMRLGGLFLVGTVGIALLLSVVMEYNVKVKATATVRPEREVQIVQGSREGTVKRIEVAEKQVIEQGDAIAYIDSPHLPELQNQQQTLKTHLENNRTQIDTLEFQLARLDKQIVRESALAATASDPNYQIERALAQIARSRPERGIQLERQRNALLKNRETLTRRLNQTDAQLRSVEEQLDRIVVRSPIPGKILQLNLRNPGQVLQPGEPIVRIIPQNTPLVVKAQVPAQDIGRVKPGQTVQLRISAYPYPDYGTATGKVQDISPDVLPCQGNCWGGATAYYEATIILDDSNPLRKNAQLQPGMEAIADIISRKERVATFILRKARLLADL
ncbi:HlyD family efflux transporter periplasmic adaptor subunit [Lusitaniella coriacea LEGE 07157]|uniref:HlyD family efflux transporter periplasmic adaptor subunit n=1 Tax=Lusitaniella coriacea LEGE 07157 TaxID=945747 RepID=A0A8J7DYV2_9CYAN|nr:HlyD family efflux transporter periplasmic adaptor subunit [Lusitaniella coriacea]MBE9118071.1 HlyD family efflux transporter periplasmic adaptor subunit [Lusitaniella coriacea LEGE 07157]